MNFKTKIFTVLASCLISSYTLANSPTLDTVCELKVGSQVVLLDYVNVTDAKGFFPTNHHSWDYNQNYLNVLTIEEILPNNKIRVSVAESSAVVNMKYLTPIFWNNITGGALAQETKIDKSLAQTRIERDPSANKSETESLFPEIVLCDGTIVMRADARNRSVFKYADIDSDHLRIQIQESISYLVNNPYFVDAQKNKIRLQLLDFWFEKFD